MIATFSAAVLLAGALGAEPTPPAAPPAQPPAAEQPAATQPPAKAQAPAKPPCPMPIKPGVSIGRVKLGMTLDELQSLGTLTPIEAPFKGEEGWHQLVAGTDTFRVRVGPDKRVLVAAVRGSQLCIDDGGERILNMKGKGAQQKAPLADCGLQAAAHWASWRCEEHGVEFAWEGTAQSPGAFVFHPKAFEVSEKQVPTAPWLDASASAKGCPKGTTHAELACDFFEGNTQLECFLPNPCMARLTKPSGEHVDLHAADGTQLGRFTWARNGRSLVHKFEKPVEKGTAFRVIFDLEVASPGNPRENREPHSVVFVHGGRRMNGGFTLDLVAPEPKPVTAPAPAAKGADLPRKDAGTPPPAGK